MRIVARLAQLVGSIGLFIVPVWWHNKLALAKSWPIIAYHSANSLRMNWAVLGFFGCAALMVCGQWTAERAAAKQQKLVGGDRALMEAYAAAVKNSIQSAAVAHNMTAEDRLSAQKNILITIANIVHLYYDKKDDLEINACYMQAYSTDDLPVDVAGRVMFKEKTRRLDTYAHVLDLILWAKDCEPKQMALPVEDPSDSDMKFKLLPGAPAAFALRKTQTVQSTDDLEPYFNEQGRNVDAVVRDAQIKYFRDQGFESFVSIPIETDDTMIGVLNVQSNKRNILGPRNRHEKPVTNLLEPLRHALGLLITATTPGPDASPIGGQQKEKHDKND